jgi:glycolate oxidase FAD binding subunit
VASLAGRPLNDRAVKSLAAIAGEENVAVEPSVCANFAVDGSVPRWVVYPRSAEAVAGVLQHATELGLAVMPCRNGTKLQIGNPPCRYDIALCLKDMNQIHQFEPDDLTIAVGPGIEFGELQELLSRRRLWLPLDPTGGARASAGGIVATNSTGPLRLRYGAPRDMVVGMKVALASGKIIKTGGRVVKNVAGYDLAKLMIGSYGTLGIIVETNFKLYPLPARCATWRIEIASLEVAREFRRRILDSPLSPVRMVLLDSGAVAFGRAEAQASGLQIWVEFGGSEAVISRSGETVQEISSALCATASVFEDSLAEAVWNRILNLSTADSAHPWQLILKSALPIGAVEEFVQLVHEAAQTANLPCACFCQNGVGIVHACFPGSHSIPSLRDLVTSLRKAAIGKGGSLVIVRCPSKAKTEIDVWGQPGDDFHLMRKLKNVWDPKGTLSPGRFLAGL